MDNIEHELCNNCKKEIPHTNYVMHTMHCARNITLCQTCKEPIQKNQFEEHKKKCVKSVPVKKPLPSPPTSVEASLYFQTRKAIEDKKAEARKERYLQKMERLVDTGYSLKTDSKAPASSVSTTEIKQNGISKFHNSPSTGAIAKKPEAKSSGMLACKFCDLELPKLDLEEHENYCGSRTDKCLECGELVMFKDKQAHMDSNHGYLKTRNGPAPQPPSYRRRNPPTELVIPCEFCDVPVPHEDLIQHETGCRPDLARFNPRRRSPEPEDFLLAPEPASPEVELPCEFCGDMIPASQLLGHQVRCS